MARLVRFYSHSWGTSEREGRTTSEHRTFIKEEALGKVQSEHPLTSTVESLHFLFMLPNSALKLLQGNIYPLFHSKILMNGSHQAPELLTLFVSISCTDQKGNLREVDQVNQVTLVWGKPPVSFRYILRWQMQGVGVALGRHTASVDLLRPMLLQTWRTKEQIEKNPFRILQHHINSV